MEHASPSMGCIGQARGMRSQRGKVAEVFNALRVKDEASTVRGSRSTTTLGYMRAAYLIPSITSEPSRRIPSSWGLYIDKTPNSLYFLTTY